MPSVTATVEIPSKDMIRALVRSCNASHILKTLQLEFEIYSTNLKETSKYCQTPDYYYVDYSWLANELGILADECEKREV